MKFFMSLLYSALIFKTGMYIGWVIETKQPIQFMIALIIAYLWWQAGLMIEFNDKVINGGKR